MEFIVLLIFIWYEYDDSENLGTISVLFLMLVRTSLPYCQTPFCSCGRVDRALEERK